MLGLCGIVSLYAGDHLSFAFQAYAFLGPTNELFLGELEEVVVKVSNCLKTLNAFRKSYEDHRAKLKTYYKKGETVVEWEFAAPLVFARFDKFVKRVSTLKVSEETTPLFVSQMEIALE